MDKLGRRPLLLVPMVVMVLILALITIALKLQVNSAYVSDMSLLLFNFTCDIVSGSICLHQLWNDLRYELKYKNIRGLACGSVNRE